MNPCNRRGFAVPTAILVIAVLTASLAAGFSLVSAERRIVDDEKAQITAFTLAQQGLETFLLSRDSLGLYITPPGVRDSVRITLTGGYADVVSTRMMNTVNKVGGLYVVRSKGVQTTGLYANTPQGVRVISQLARWQPAALQVLAGWTALAGLNKAGAAGVIAGTDNCGDSATKTGVVIGDGDAFSGKTSPVTGDPPIDTLANTDVKIDWGSVSAGTAFTPTVTIPPGVWPSFADTAYYPVILVKEGYGGTFTLPGSGRGTLIVQGNLDINGDLGWEGVMMVGGKLTANGGNTMNGTVLSGLNKMLGYAPDPSSADANGTKDYHYNSCSVAKAMAALGKLVPLPNTWVDNWKSY